MPVFSARSRNNLQRVQPSLVRVLNEAIKNTPIDFTVVEGVRADQRQKELFAQGRTSPGKIVTQVDGVTKKSKHQKQSDGFSHAVDIYPYRNGSVQINDVQSLKVIAKHIKEIAHSMGVKISWGGDWKSFKDYPHFELL